MSVWSKIYSLIGWENQPSTKTPINASNLNKMDVAINELDDRVLDLGGSVENILGNFATEYDSTSTYAVGDYVIYDGLLYKCVVAITTAESFDSTKWSKTDCGREFNSVIDELGNIGEILSKAEQGGTIATATSTAMASITIPKGTWIIQGIAQFQSNATGTRTINIWTTSGYNGGGIGAKGVTVSAVNGARTDITTMQIVAHNSSVTYYLNALQTSGSTLNINTELKAVRIK